MLHIKWNLVNKLKRNTTLKSPGIMTLIQLATVIVKFLLNVFGGPLEFILTSSTYESRRIISRRESCTLSYIYNYTIRYNYDVNMYIFSPCRHDTVVHYLDTSSLYGLTDVERE